MTYNKAGVNALKKVRGVIASSCVNADIESPHLPTNVVRPFKVALGVWPRMLASGEAEASHYMFVL